MRRPAAQRGRRSSNAAALPRPLDHRGGALTTPRLTPAVRCAPRVPEPRPLVQTLALGYWSLHYAKRILETFFVHKCAPSVCPTRLR